MNKWNQKVMFPKDSDYIIRVASATFGPNNSGNPMITIEWELMGPETKYSGNEEYIMTGQKFKTYHVTKSFNEDGTVNEEKTAKVKARLEDMYNKLGADFTNFDPDNADLSGFHNKSVYAELYAKPEEKFKMPTPDQLRAGKKVGDAMTDPLTGKKLVTYPIKLAQIFGLAGGL